MTKILIVDDEEDIRQGLSELIPFEELGCTLGGLMEDGAQALDLFRREAPEIIITDIKMPRMDGLELIEIVKRESPETRMVVLSGYDDFDLVRRAMKLGAEDYLLKPVDPEEIGHTLKEILRELDRTVNIVRTRGEEIILNNLLNRLVRNDIPVSEFRQKAEVMGFPLTGHSFLAGVLDLSYKTLLSPSREENPWEFSLFKEFITAANHLPGIHIFKDFESPIGFVLSFHAPQDRERALAGLERFIRHSRQGMTCCAVYGPVVGSYREIEGSYRRALGLLPACRLSPVPILVNTEQGPSPEELLEAEALAKELFQLWLRRSEKEMIRLWTAEKGMSSPLSLGITLDHLLLRIRRRRGIHLAEFLPSDGPALLEALKPLQEEETIGRLCRFLNSFSREEEKPEYTPHVQQLLEHLENHYSDPNLNLKTASYRMGISAEHAGRLFKKEVGAFFSDILARKRIEASKELLLNSGLPATEIAHRVGFLNNNYFYTKFKKYTGQNPTDFRRTP